MIATVAPANAPAINSLLDNIVILLRSGDPFFLSQTVFLGIIVAYGHGDSKWETVKDW